MVGSSHKIVPETKYANDSSGKQLGSLTINYERTLYKSYKSFFKDYFMTWNDHIMLMFSA